MFNRSEITTNSVKNQSIHHKKGYGKQQQPLKSQNIFSLQMLTITDECVRLNPTLLGKLSTNHLPDNFDQLILPLTLVMHNLGT